MTQSIRVTCVQKYDNGSVIGIGEYESNDMSLTGWRKAIEAAAIAATFDLHMVREFVLDWAAHLEAAE